MSDHPVPGHMLPVFYATGQLNIPLALILAQFRQLSTV